LLLLLNQIKIKSKSKIKIMNAYDTSSPPLRIGMVCYPSIGGSGIVATPWQELMAKVIPVSHRGPDCLGYIFEERARRLDPVRHRRGHEPHRPPRVRERRLARLRSRAAEKGELAHALAVALRAHRPDGPRAREGGVGEEGAVLLAVDRSQPDRVDRVRGHRPPITPDRRDGKGRGSSPDLPDCLMVGPTPAEAAMEKSFRAPKAKKRPKRPT